MLHQERSDHPGGGALPIRARDVHHPERLLRVAEHTDESTHVIEREPLDQTGSGLEIDMGLEVGDRLVEVHGTNRSERRGTATTQRVGGEWCAACWRA